MASVDIVDPKVPPIHLSDVVHLVKERLGSSPEEQPSSSNRRSSSWAAEERQKHDPTLNTPMYPSRTPSSRSGPPRPLDYSLTSSPTTSRRATEKEDYNSPIVGGPDLMEPNEVSSNFAITRGESSFRSALESSDRKGKGRATTMREPYPHQRQSDSPKEAHNWVDLRRKDGVDSDGTPRQLPKEENNHSNVSPHRPRRAETAPLPKTEEEEPKPRSSKWARLRSLLPYIVRSHQEPGSMAVIPKSVTVPNELLYGGLTALMLRLWFERDEKGRRRIPMLFHRVRIRISDSLHPLDGSRSVFRIECDYADGALRWVIYRQLRDFVSLHTHYRLSNAYNRTSDHLPEFPRTSIPYFKFLTRERGGHIAREDFSRLQRAALEDYLINLMKAVMFQPSSNRFAQFLEVSSLFISLARTGGCQVKAGFLRIHASGNKGPFGRKEIGWFEGIESRWCAVRDNCLVVVVESGELTLWDVFLFDSDFKIERPKRYYRQKIHLLHGVNDQREKDNHIESTGTISRFMSKILHFCLPSAANADHVGDTGTDTLRSLASSVSSNTASSRAPSPTPMLDPSINTNPLAATGKTTVRNPEPEQDRNDKPKKRRTTDVSKHTFYIENSQVRLKLVARNERQMLQWITALEKAAAASPFTRKNRYDSFAPIRKNVAAQWLIDGRDYFWNLSRAILLARETIYIHDWWLSPELQLRRPNKPHYRLDKLLERKAREGVKIYIIIYQEVSSRTTPIDSNYAKQRLLSLHPNIMLQRSPSHLQTGTLCWAHHEKMCVIDQAVGFTGGLDLCFGRWDTPQHVLTDDPQQSHETSIWPGKDYSNPRFVDFHTLNKPEEDMYDRSKIPRMPWHDVGIQVVGQPARDLARHFIERWNYLLRIKNHTRTMPFLLPPSDFRPGELERLGLAGTCEVQICRSAGSWSLGTPGRCEQSIQNAYVKAIQLSEHFIYIENQFFITSTVVNEVKIENKIGDAIVNRVRRAFRERTPWKCCIVLPLLPGFSFPVDQGDASAIRIILECQNRTISRGPKSIFARLRKDGIDPNQYISFFSLRKWAKLRGEVLTTEQVYIHDKLCIVDDRVAIIGSANINERSMRGDRDSELAAVIRDTDLMDSTMAGRPFKVGRFAHTLRVRLMQEHLGVDVDALLEDDFVSKGPAYNTAHEQQSSDSDVKTQGDERNAAQSGKAHQSGSSENLVNTKTEAIKHVDDGEASMTDTAPDAVNTLPDGSHRRVGMVTGTLQDGGNHTSFVASSPGDETNIQQRQSESQARNQRSNDVSQVRNPGEGENKSTPSESTEKRHKTHSEDQALSAIPVRAPTANGFLRDSPLGLLNSVEVDKNLLHASLCNDDTNEKALPKAPSKSSNTNNTWRLPTPPDVDPCGFEDPISDRFWKNVWVDCAVHNTEIYRRVFHAIPDDLVTTWRQYKEFILWHERLSKPCSEEPPTAPAAGYAPSEGPEEVISTRGEYGKPGDAEIRRSHEGKSKHKIQSPPSNSGVSDNSSLANVDLAKQKPHRVSGLEPFEKWEREEMERLLGELRGNLVVYPTQFLEGEDAADNFLFNADRLLPLLIYD